MAATARWLTQLVREACERPEERVRFLADARDDASTLRALQGITASLARTVPRAAMAHEMIGELLARCDEKGQLPEEEVPTLRHLTMQLETSLA
jgi:hypothetical protein